MIPNYVIEYEPNGGKQYTMTLVEYKWSLLCVNLYNPLIIITSMYFTGF